MSTTSPCSICTRRCCAEYTVSITGQDAWRIHHQLKIPYLSFLVYYPVAEPHERCFKLDNSNTYYDIALDKSGAFAKGNPCVFWIDLHNGRGRCGIYESRPLVCQTYPAYIQQSMVMLRDDVYCPEGSWHLANMTLSQFGHQLQEFQLVLDTYAYLIDAWNQNLSHDPVNCPRTIVDFLAYMDQTYLRLADYYTSLGDQLRTTLLPLWSQQRGENNPLFLDLTPSHGLPALWDEFLDTTRILVSQQTLQRAQCQAGA